MSIRRFLFVVRVKRRECAALDEGGAMKYLLSFVVEEGGMEDASPEEMREAMERWSAFDQEATERGALIACEPLEATSAATTLHIREDGQRIVSDGPFAETKEQLGGFCLLECASHEEALEWARKVPMRSGAIEIRPVMDLSQFGYESKTVTPAKATA
jgi:hypothetical protein